KVCSAAAPYTSFSCPTEIAGQRLDGPAAFFYQDRLFVVAREHLQAQRRKRTALFELVGDAEAGALSARVWGELPSAGDTAYAGVVGLDEGRVLLSWYSSNLDQDPNWVIGILDATDIWLGTLDLGRLR